MVNEPHFTQMCCVACLHSAHRERLFNIPPHLLHDSSGMYISHTITIVIYYNSGASDEMKNKNEINNFNTMEQTV